MPHCKQCQKEVRVLVGNRVCPRCLAGAALPGSEVSNETPSEEEVLLADRYRLGEKLGEGGFGTVYLAEQLRPVQRQVAIKILHADRVSKEVLARFEAERQALAMMDHPHIATIYDGGEDAGAPFFVMEYVDGLSITEFCEEEALSVNAQLSLFIQVCEAVHYAHQKGIIHRDLKPSNILVSRADGNCKVIDFGIAKAMDASLTDRTYYTQMFQLVGTPAYMSPEQADTSQQSVDTRSDVYSLGAILYELLAGSPPFRQREMAERPLDEVLRQLREEQPDRPSTRLTASEPQVSTRNLKQFHGDLDWITMRALAKEPERRYGAASELAEDIRRYQNNEPVSATPPSRRYLLGKFMGRHRVGVTAAAAIAIAVLGALAVSLTMFFRAEQARQDEAAARQDEQQSREEVAASAQKLQRAFSQADFRIGEEMMQNGRSMDGAAYWARAIRTDPSNHLASANLMSLLAQGRIALPLTPWLEAPQQVNRIERQCLDRSGKRGAVLYSTAERAIVGVWDFETQAASMIPMDADTSITELALSPDGEWFCVSTAQGQLQFWDVETALPKHAPAPHDSPVTHLELIGDGHYVATATRNGQLRLWRANDGSLAAGPLALASDIVVLEGGHQRPIVAAGCIDGKTVLWGLNQPDGITLSHDSSVRSIAFNGDDSLVVTGSEDRTARVWLCEDGRPTIAPVPHPGSVNCLAVSHDGNYFLTGASQEARLWSIYTGELAAPVVSHLHPVQWVSFSSNDEHAMSASLDGDLRLWNTTHAQQGRQRMSLGTGHVILALSQDARRLLVGSLTSPRVQTWRLTGTEMGSILLEPAVKLQDQIPHFGSFTRPKIEGPTQDRQLDPRQPFGKFALAIHPDGSRVAMASADQGVSIWETSTGRAIPLHDFELGSWLDLRFDEDGEHLTGLRFDGTMVRWSLSSGYAVGKEAPGKPALPVGNLARSYALDGFRSKGTYLAGRLNTNSNERVLFDESSRQLSWHGGQREEQVPLVGAQGKLRTLAFSADGMTGVASEIIGQAWLFDTHTGTPIGDTLVHGSPINACDSVNDRRMIATGAADKTVILWRVDETGHAEKQHTLQHDGPVTCLAFTADGRYLLSGTTTGWVSVWESMSGRQMTQPFRHRHGIAALSVFPDNSRILIGLGNGAARLWDLPPFEDAPLELANRTEATIQRSFDASGKLQTRAQAPSSPSESMISSDLWKAWMSWLEAAPNQRPISPYANINQSPYLTMLLARGGTASMDEASRFIHGETDAHFKAGTIAAGRAELDRMIQIGVEVLDRGAGNANAWKLLGDLLKQKADLLEHLGAAPRGILVHRRLACLAYLMPEGRRHTFADSPQAAENRAKVKVLCGLPSNVVLEEEMEVLAQAIEFPGFERHPALRHFLKAEAWNIHGQPNYCIGDIEKSVKWRPNDSTLLGKAGRYYLRWKKPAMSAGFYRRAMNAAHDEGNSARTRDYARSLLSVSHIAKESVDFDELPRTEKIVSPVNGHSYQRIDAPLMWKHARIYCEKLGGYLATIESAEENRFLYRAFASEAYCWLGATDEQREGDWRWINGEPLTLALWSSGEPNNVGPSMKPAHYLMLGAAEPETLADGEMHYPWVDFDKNGSIHSTTIQEGCPLCEWDE